VVQEEVPTIKEVANRARSVKGRKVTARVRKTVSFLTIQESIDVTLAGSTFRKEGRRSMKLWITRL
jgi:hypothetical protein